MTSSSAQAGRYDYASLAEAFPEIDPGFTPFGARVLVQLRRPKTSTASGIALPQETVETEKWNEQTGRVIALGPLCFCNRDTQKEWVEGAWFKVGAFVRVPKHGGDRFELPNPDFPNQKILFCVCKDLEVIGGVTKNPLDVVAFI